MKRSLMKRTLIAQDQDSKLQQGAEGIFPFMHRQESVSSPAANGTVDFSSWQALPGSRSKALD